MQRKKKCQKLSRTHIRDKILFFICYSLFFIVLLRLFYWQVIKGNQLQAVAQGQYQKQVTSKATRGQIFSSEGYLLAGNKTVYRVYADPQSITENTTTLSEKILPLILSDYEEYQEATDEAIKAELEDQIHQDIENKLNQKDKQWISLKNKISEESKTALEKLDIYGIGFEPYQTRFHPEASMAAHVLGFVGKNDKGEDTGYFGIEGALDKELKGSGSQQFMEFDALGLQHALSKIRQKKGLQGRDVYLTIRRDVQMHIETILKKGIEKYQAKSGEVIVMEPQTGKIIALAAFPRYDPSRFYAFDPSLYKNPTLANQYEPGSTFKTLTVAIGLDTQSVTPDTPCTNCDQPKKIGKYTIRTWNDVYHPNITMTEALAKSDNTAMIFIAEKVGQKAMISYLKKFGIGQEIGLDLQEDGDTPFRDTWGEIHLATASFGQGIVTNSLQMVRAVASIANQGKMMHPYIVEKVFDPSSEKEITTQPKPNLEVISKETAAQVTQMMVQAAEAGEAQWTASATHTIAGKTGTSQVVTEDGYDEEKTIASFIGFAPASDPQFVMLVKLVEPTSSPWAAETAAPLWYQIANQLFLLLDIPPDKIHSSTSQDTFKFLE